MYMYGDIFLKFPVDFVVKFHFRFSCWSLSFCFRYGSVMLCNYVCYVV